jgi:hypothetical protein
MPNGLQIQTTIPLSIPDRMQTTPLLASSFLLCHSQESPHKQTCRTNPPHLPQPSIRRKERLILLISPSHSYPSFLLFICITHAGGGGGGGGGEGGRGGGTHFTSFLPFFNGFLCAHLYKYQAHFSTPLQLSPSHFLAFHPLSATQTHTLHFTHFTRKNLALTHSLTSSTNIITSITHISRTHSHGW